MARKPSPRKQSLAAKYWTEAETDAFFCAVKESGDVRDWALFQIIYRRGLRATEASLLWFADYNMSQRRLFIHALKGSLSDEFWLTEMEAEALEAWLAVRGLEPGPLFTSRKKKLADVSALKRPRKIAEGALGRVQIYRLVQRYCTQAGIAKAKAHPHALRHSCGTHLLKMTKDLTVVQHWLRHKDARSTQVYAHFTRKDEVAEQMQGWGKKA